MASRKDQKEQLRREREEREAAAKGAERRRRLIGYAAGAAVVIAAVAIGAILLAGGGDSGGDGETAGGGDKQVEADVLPKGGTVPAPQRTPLTEAVQASGCELRSYRADAREHTEDLKEKIDYESKPPTSGRHYAIEAQDGAYEVAPDVKELVHALEHGRIVIWFKKDLPKAARADLMALYEEDPFQMLLTPDETGSEYEVTATAWNRDPPELGTGRLLGCEKYSPEIFEAIRAFKTEHRSNGPEPVP